MEFFPGIGFGQKYEFNFNHFTNFFVDNLIILSTKQARSMKKILYKILPKR